MLKHQLSLAAESTYGTFVNPTRPFEILPGESLERQNTAINSSGLRPGLRAPLGSRRVLTRRMGSGSVSLEVATTGFGILFEHALGSVSTSQPDNVGAPSVYEHTFTLGDLTGKSLTIQKGVEKADGTVQPFNFLGSKITGWELNITNDGFLTLEVTIDAADVETTSPLETLTYPTRALFHFAQGSLLVDDVAVAAVTEATISGENPMATERYFLGQAGVKNEPLENDFRSISGSLSADFVDAATFYDRFAADASTKLELKFVGSVIEGGYSEELSIVLNDIRFTGDTPKISGPTYAVQSVPFEALQPDTGDLISILYRTTDATP